MTVVRAVITQVAWTGVKESMITKPKITCTPPGRSRRGARDWVQVLFYGRTSESPRTRSTIRRNGYADSVNSA